MFLVATALRALSLLDPPFWAETLAPLDVENVNTHRSGAVRFYRSDGAIDGAALEELTRVADGPSPEHPDDASDADGEMHDAPHALSPRLLQLVVKAAYHFRGAKIFIISGYRPQLPFRGSRHAIGSALDFRLEGVRARDLALYLYSLPRAGVGFYPHPRTQYVHLDVREESYHWVDGSPPGVTWREQQVRDWGRAKRDEAYQRDMDLPVP